MKAYGGVDVHCEGGKMKLLIIINSFKCSAEIYTSSLVLTLRLFCTYMFQPLISAIIRQYLYNPLSTFSAIPPPLAKVYNWGLVMFTMLVFTYRLKPILQII
jgi:hypothetical protein